MRFLSGVIFLFGVIFSGIISCSVNDTIETGGMAWLNVQLTDAPGDFDAVFIDIQNVRVQRSGDDTDAADSNDKDTADGWHTINDEPIRVDLLKLRNGNTIQLGDEELEAGRYNQIRLVLGPDNEVVIDGQSFPLKTPSAQQSGLKMNIDAQIDEGETYNLLVDFDAGRSVVETGNQKFILKPVLRAVQLEETGSISGSVQPGDVQTSVLAISQGDTLSTITEDNGNFAIIGVKERIYNVVLNPKSGAYADTTLTNINVQDEQDIDLGTIRLREQ